jgi:hypothetical protein
MFTTVMKWGFILVTLYMGNASSQQSGNPAVVCRRERGWLLLLAHRIR